jgi:ADP-ribose pyrophosphatase YjhB (NUDIX family)
MGKTDVSYPEEFKDVHGKIHIRPAGVIPQWRLSAYATVKNDEGQTLLVRTPWQEELHLPGGALEFGESFTDAVIRETREETGYQIIPDNFPRRIAQGTFYIPGAWRRDGVDAYCCTVAYFFDAKLHSMRQDKEAVRVSRETDSVHWLDTSVLPAMRVHFFFRDALFSSY